MMMSLMCSLSCWPAADRSRALMVSSLISTRTAPAQRSTAQHSTAQQEVIHKEKSLDGAHQS
jgi:hypothetical protein